MPNRYSPNDRLVALFALGILLFTYPFISLCNRALTFLGIPLLYIYLFVAWAGIISGIILVTYYSNGNKVAKTKRRKSPEVGSLR